MTRGYWAALLIAQTFFGQKKTLPNGRGKIAFFN
jgi:hypothetical protein